MLRAVTSDTEEDFAALLAEYEKETGPERRRKLAVGDTVEGPVVSIGDDAVFVELGSKAEAMLEIDQVTDKDGNLTVAVGDVIEARVVDLGGKSGCVMLRRSVGRGPQAIDDLLAAAASGMPVEGVVEGTNKGGFDVQIAGVRAFCPVSQIDIRFVENPEEHVGARYQFRITKVDQGRGGRVDLVVSRRALLQEEAAAQAEETIQKLQPGAVFDGTVTSVMPYGAFVDLGGLEGMIHISELGHVRVEHPSEVVREGQKVSVVVLKVEQTDNPKRPYKIGLSLKALQDDPWDTTAGKLAVGSRVTGTVVRTQPFGAFVELAPGVQGLVHISELGAGRRINHPREVVSEGQEVEVTILGIDLDRKRISLSMGDGPRGDQAAAGHDEPAAAPVSTGQNTSLGTLGDLLSRSLDKKK
jgi:small subunit ribosomal protein S1